MLHTNKISQNTSAESKQNNRRKNTDRRSSKSDTKFPFVDNKSKLVIRDRRKADRRAEDANVIKAVRKLFQI